MLAVGLATCAAVCALGNRPAAAFEWSLRLDGALAIPLTKPQSDLYSLGGAGFLKAAVGVSWLDFHLGAGYIALPGSAAGTDAADGIAAGGGLRLKLNRLTHRVSPWIDGDAFYVRTGDLDRFGFAAAVGVSFPLDERRSWFLSPVFRYLQVVQPDRAGFDNRDAKILMAGLEIEWSSKGYPQPEQVCPENPKVVCPSDRDGDGLLDSVDACPDQPGVPSGHGCPDADGDGVPDAKDKCPAIPGPAATQGCPDRDGDGVLDADDKCPDAPGPAAFHGCPDTDGDGLHDDVDECPQDKGPASTHGCPDSDGDGVPDRNDLCPCKAGDPANRGCPVHKLVEVTAQKLEIMQKVYFATDKSVILSKSFKLLDEVAAVLNDAHDVRIRIEGHTDNQGTREHNQKLSEDRAKSVRAYLVKKGIQADRLETAGYGQDKPVMSNDTSDGREMNRRVEFLIIQQSQPGQQQPGPTGGAK